MSSIMYTNHLLQNHFVTKSLATVSTSDIMANSLILLEIIQCALAVALTFVRIIENTSSDAMGDASLNWP